MPSIGIDCRLLGPRPSGIAEAVAALALHAPDLAPDLDFVLLRDPAAGPASDPRPNVHNRMVASAPNGPLSMWLLPLVANLGGIDLFHAPANILPAALPMPAVTTVHDVMWLADPELCHQRWPAGLERRFYAHGLRRALRRSAAIACVSEATREAVAMLAPEAGAQAVVTRSGVSPDFRPVARDRAALAAMGLDPARRFVLTIGQNAPYKNHAGAVRAFALAFAGSEERDLVFVQRRGAGAAELQTLAASLGIAGRVKFVPQVTRQELVQLYGAAEALLHPSLCEGFGNPLAEAMACGLPVVTSTVSAMPEVTGGAALLADPRDPAALASALRRIRDEPALAADLRARGLARAAQLDWRDFARENVAIYRSVLARSASTRAMARRQSATE